MDRVDLTSNNLDIRFRTLTVAVEHSPYRPRSEGAKRALVSFVVTDEREKRTLDSFEKLPEDELLMVAIEVQAGGGWDDCQRRAEAALAAQLRRLAEKLHPEAPSAADSN